MTIPTISPAQALLHRLTESSSHTLAAVRLECMDLSGGPSSRTIRGYKYYIDGIDVTAVVGQLVQEDFRWLRGFGNALPEETARSRHDDLLALGSKNHHLSTTICMTMPKGLVVEGFLLHASSYKGEHGNTMHTVTVLLDDGRAFETEFSEFARLAPCATAGPVVAEMLQEFGHRARRSEGLRIQLGWGLADEGALVLRFGDDLPALEDTPEPPPSTLKRGGAGRGQGRKPLDEERPTVSASIRMTVEQREKLDRLGGAKWLRARIDEAQVPSA